MQAPVTSLRFSLTWRRLLMSALCAASVLMLTTAAPAQGTDDDGVLPAGNTGGQQTASGNGGSSTNASAATTVGITAVMDDDVLVPEQASLCLSSIVGDTNLATEVDPAEATFVADTGGLTIEQTPGVVSLQGRGVLWMNGNLSAGFGAPDDALTGTFVLVLGDGTASLDDVKNGDSQPLLVADLGDLPSFDLNFFYAVATSHAADLPGIFATLVYVSIDSNAELHTSAVRLSTSGGPIEVVIE